MKTLTKMILALGVLGVSALSADGATLTKRCAACHGATFEKHAMGKSHIVKGWKADKVLTALKGYKAGTYGGAMKGVMKGQVASLNEEQMKEIATYIESLKK